MWFVQEGGEPRGPGWQALPMANSQIPPGYVCAGAPAVAYSSWAERSVSGGSSTLPPVAAAAFTTGPGVARQTSCRDLQLVPGV